MLLRGEKGEKAVPAGEGGQLVQTSAEPFSMCRLLWPCSRGLAVLGSAMRHPPLCSTEATRPVDLYCLGFLLSVAVCAVHDTLAKLDSHSNDKPPS